MNKEARINKIDEILREEKPISTKKIKWKDDSVYMDVYKIPLKYLVYNKYNGRIKSRVKSLERQGRNIDVASAEGKVIIEKLLWDSKAKANEITKNDIRKNGQLQVGIVTRDGIIIDGNRRAMLLDQIEKYDYFEGIILPTTVEENKREIRKLETSYQMGEDKKLDYNPIEKYLTIRDSLLEGDKVEEVAEWMGESEKQINEWVRIMKIMDDYLDFLGYNGIYTQLDGREDQFINLTKWLSSLYYKGSSAAAKGFDGYKNTDVDDLRDISFDYVRVKYEGKRFRILAYGQKQNNFFGDRQIWNSFKDNHFKNIQSIHDEEESINTDSQNLTATLNDRDNKFRAQAQELLEDNLAEHQQKIYNQRHKDEPVKLIAKSIDAVNVAKDNKNIEKPEVLDKVKQLNEITTNILQKSSPKELLKQILNLLSSVSVSKHVDEKEDLLEHIKDIQREAFQLEKEIKHLK